MFWDDQFGAVVVEFAVRCEVGFEDVLVGFCVDASDEESSDALVFRRVWHFEFFHLAGDLLRQRVVDTVVSVFDSVF